MYKGVVKPVMRTMDHQDHGPGLVLHLGRLYSDWCKAREGAYKTINIAIEIKEEERIYS